MSFSMSQASLPVFEIGLNALSAVLDKAEAHAAAKKIDSSVLLNSRLSPDMFALARQVQIATDQAKNGSARLAGVEAPRYEDDETTMDQLKARLAKTVAYLKTLDPKQIDASADREITTPARAHRHRDRCAKPSSRLEGNAQSQMPTLRRDAQNLSARDIYQWRAETTDFAGPSRSTLDCLP